MDKNKIIIECECGTHLLQISFDGDEDMPCFYLAMFEFGSGKMSFWKRLKLAWKFLRTGETYADQMVLHPAEAEKLFDFLEETLFEKTENEVIPELN